MAMYIICKKCAASVFGSPDYQRLEAAIAEAKINLGQQTAASVATQHLKKAEEYMAEWNIALRDDSANNTYLKISLRRRSLFQLFLVICIGILSFLVLSMLQMLPPPFSDPKAVAAAILFGVLGAALSVGLGLLSADVSAKVPSQQIGAFIIWMRPGIGAVAALVALALIYANSNLKIFAFTSTDFSVIAVVAFAAGFSERFILGAIEKISQGKSKD